MAGGQKYSYNRGIVGSTKIDSRDHSQDNFEDEFGLNDNSASFAAQRNLSNVNSLADGDFKGGSSYLSSSLKKDPM